MAQNDVFKRYLDAGAEFTQTTRKRAEQIVKELLEAGEEQAEQATAAITDLVERSRESTESLIEQIRSEVTAQVKHLGLATRAEVTRLEKRINKAVKAPAKKAPATKPAAKKPTAKKAPAAKKAGREEDRCEEGFGCEEDRRQEGFCCEASGQHHGLGLPTSARRPLDQEMVRRGLSEDRDQARAAINAQHVMVGGAIATKPTRQVAPGEAVVVVAPSTFVSRGGDKLAAALEYFGLDVGGRIALDAGSSTGGFTDCLLQQGAATVVAVDVGTHQLHERLRVDPRVVLYEQTNIRDVPLSAMPEPASIVVADLSFTSLRPLLGHLAALARPGADVVLLVKPQFEATRVEADRARGVIRDPAVWRRALVDVQDALVGLGAAIMGGMASPVRGTHGNVEFLIHARIPDHGAPDPDHAGDWIDDVVASVESR